MARQLLVVVVAVVSWGAQADSPEACLGEWRAHRLATPRHVTLRVVDGYGDEVPAGAFVGEQVLSALPWSAMVPECLESVEVRLPQTDERRQVRLVSDQLTLRVGARRARASVSAFGEVASVIRPGWGDGVFSRGGAGARADVWGRYAHASFALKGSTFATNVYPQTPQLVFDLFVGLSHDWVVGSTTVFLALDAGLWSSIVPSLRATLAVTLHPAFLTSEQDLVVSAWAGPSVFPLAAAPPLDRGVRYRDLPFERFIFMNVGLAVGWAFL